MPESAHQGIRKIRAYLTCFGRCRILKAWARKLQTRLLLVFLALIVAMQTLIYIASHLAIDETTRRHAVREVAVGERVLHQLLAQTHERLAQAAGALPPEYTFRLAVATKDWVAVGAALETQVRRSNADLAMLVDPTGRVVASSGTVSDGLADLARGLVSRSDYGTGHTPIIAAFEGRAYQFALSPVRHRRTLAWVIIGSSIDRALVSDVRDLTGLHVSIWIAEPVGDQWKVLATTSNGIGSPPPPPDSFDQRDIVQTPDTPSGFHTQFIPLLMSNGPKVVVTLQQSFLDASVPFQGLHVMLFSLSVASLILSFLGSAWIARRITGPVTTLAESAQRMEGGDYSIPVTVTGDGELADLAAAVEHMRAGIAARERRILDLAYIDPLTRLGNRTQFAELLEAALEGAKRGQVPFAVLLIDLDRFRYVNDTLGHQVGDLLLSAVAGKLQATLKGGGEVLARLGGDEFAVLLVAENAHGARIVGNRLAKVLSTPINIEGHLIDVAGSIGIAAYPDHGQDAETLLRRADVAMYAAKRRRAGVGVYDPRHDDNTLERLSLLAELRRAVECGEFRLVFQPKLDLACSETRSAEVLLRWRHPERGEILPAKFIAFAEQTGYIRHITRWVIEHAVEQCAAWRRGGLHLTLSMNISAQDLLDADFVRYVADRLTHHGVGPGEVVLELTESAVMEDRDRALESLQQLSSMGVGLSIDDFGTGYSSLAYLRELPVGELKIDRSFVLGLGTPTADETIVRSTIMLAHNMGLRVTAEGVENAKALTALRRLGCDMAQGYFIGPPQSATGLERWMISGAFEQLQDTEKPFRLPAVGSALKLVP